MRHKSDGGINPPLPLFGLNPGVRRIYRIWPTKRAKGIKCYLSNASRLRHFRSNRRTPSCRDFRSDRKERPRRRRRSFLATRSKFYLSREASEVELPEKGKSKPRPTATRRQ
ncbi:hypothetical protein KFK09_015625 [Dendrobium nobile]|uniref:Uncharacterized protein n=1 Tax=Dendrobium nobile TaxID=94219 RepID=A0A8T3B7T3_DENNO|nr:hypothetical protein KFK09_015625 [Dendrobium nobile]